jgi:hypothetical protein
MGHLAVALGSGNLHTIMQVMLLYSPIKMRART